MTTDNTLSNNINSIELDAATEEPAMVTEFDDGSMEFDYDFEVGDLPEEGVPNINKEHYANLAEDLEDDVLAEIAVDVVRRYEEDKESRSEWMETTTQGLKLLGTQLEETDDPFPGACGAHHPLILESAVKFQAKAMDALYPSKGPVKVQIVGEVNEETEAQASRIRQHMNYQIMDNMEEYFDETENMLFYLPIVGSAFKKTYYNAMLDRPVSEFVPVDQLVVNYYASNLKSATCITHKIPRVGNDLKKDIVAGLYRDCEELFQMTAPSEVSDQGMLHEEIDEISGFSPASDDEVYTLLEQYVYLDLPGEHSDDDGISLPYVVTVEKDSEKVLSIRRNWGESDSKQNALCPFTHYKFVPGMGFYGLGYIHLLGNLQITLTTAMRSLIDSGQFANLQGGFVDKRLRMKNNEGPIKPGEFKQVETAGVPISNLIQTLQFKEPSNVLMTMYKFVEERSQKFADSAEQVVADSNNQGPVGTTLALLEASTKFFSGVHKRLHQSQKHEFRTLASINFEYLEESSNFDAVGGAFEIKKEDYNGKIDIVPVSDPNLASHAQKLTVAQAIYTAALQNPAIHDLYEVSKYFYTAIGIDDEKVDKLLPQPDQAQEMDPLSDIAMAQQGKPIKAFPGQDHDSHIAIKSAFLEDPEGGGNPMMQPFLPVIQANIQEHVIMKFKENVSGAAVANGQTGGTEEQIVAQAAQRVTQQNQQIAELQAKGPDEARHKLADADVLRAQTEVSTAQADIQFKQSELTLQAMKMELEKLKEDNKMLIAGIQAESQQSKDSMNQLKELLQLALQEKQIDVYAKQSEKASQEKVDKAPES